MPSWLAAFMARLEAHLNKLSVVPI